MQGDGSERCLPTLPSDFGPCPSTRFCSVIWHLEVCFCLWTLLIQAHAPLTSFISEGELHVALKGWTLPYNAHWNLFLLTENDLEKLLLSYFYNFSCFYFSTGTPTVLLYISFTRRVTWNVDGCIFRNLWAQKSLTWIQFLFGTIFRGESMLLYLILCLVGDKGNTV